MLDNFSFSREDIKVERDVIEKQNKMVPVADLSGKGVFDAVSSNRSKQNDQNS